MPRLTARCLRAAATASSTRALVPGQADDVAFDAVDELPDLADLLLGGGGGQPFPGAQQVVEAGGQVGQGRGAERGPRSCRPRTGTSRPSGPRKSLLSSNFTFTLKAASLLWGVHHQIADGRSWIHMRFVARTCDGVVGDRDSRRLGRD